MTPTNFKKRESEARMFLLPAEDQNDETTRFLKQVQPSQTSSILDIRNQNLKQAAVIQEKI